MTVLTDAPLHPTGTPLEQQCGVCTACVDICPQHAFTGRSFHRNEFREARYDAAACDRYFNEMEKSRGVAVCGMCLYISRMEGNPDQETDNKSKIESLIF